MRLSALTAYGGLYLDQSRFWTLRSNSFPNQSLPIFFNYNTYAIQVPYFTHDADTSNTVNGLPLLWITNATAGAWNSSYGWIVIANSSNISAASTSPLVRNMEGVLLVAVNDSVVRDVNSSTNQYGLRSWYSHRNTINDAQFRANAYGALYLFASNWNHINRALLRPDVAYTDDGVWFADASNNNTVDSLDCYQFGYCLYSEYLSSDLFVINSTLNGANYGLYSYSPSGPWILNTTISNSASMGIALNGAYYSYYLVANFAISSSTFFQNYIAFQCYYCAGGIVAGNLFNASSWVAVYLGYSSGIVVKDNTVVNASWVLYLNTNADSNKFFHNNFYLSNGQTYDVGSSNAYDNGYPSGGNYWSNTTHADLYRGAGQATAGSDGINDTAANLTYGKKDNYPLSEPWPPYALLVSPANNSVIRASTVKIGRAHV